MKRTNEKALKAARRGARYLDRISPGWRDQIDLEDLDLLYPCRCILGQLDGEFYRGVYDRSLDKKMAKGYGFSVPPGVTFTQLTQAWKVIIRERDARHAAA